MDPCVNTMGASPAAKKADNSAEEVPSTFWGSKYTKPGGKVCRGQSGCGGANQREKSARKRFGENFSRKTGSQSVRSPSSRRKRRTGLDQCQVARRPRSSPAR